MNIFKISIFYNFLIDYKRYLSFLKKKKIFKFSLKKKYLSSELCIDIIDKSTRSHNIRRMKYHI